MYLGPPAAIGAARDARVLCIQAIIAQKDNAVTGHTASPSACTLQHIAPQDVRAQTHTRGPNLRQRAQMQFAADHASRLPPRGTYVDIRRVLRGTTRTSKRYPLRPGQLRHVIRDLGPEFYLE